MRGKNWVVVLLFLLTFSCGNKRTVHRGIYYWKSTFTVDDQEMARIQKAGINRLYLHLFDVRLMDKHPVPDAKIKFIDTLPDNMEIVPVIYITNETLLQITKAELSDLATNIVLLSKSLLKEKFVAIQEFQLDCDWTKKSRENYFELLRHLHRQLGKHITLSATIRLHQLKYPEQSGIPPVDRGMLMFYNMGKLADYKETNSIYKKEIAESYIENGLNYPLPLDAALGAFSWGVLFRLGRPVDLLNNITEEELILDTFITSKGSHRFEVNNEHLLHGIFLQKNDEIRIEEVSGKLLLTAAQQLNSRWQNHNFNLTIYHWDEYLFKSTSENELETVYSTFN